MAERSGARTLYIEPGSPWENGYVESFNGKLKDELLDREVFYTLLEVQVLTEQYRQTYNQIRPHSSLGYRPPAPETIQPPDLAPELVGLKYRVVQLQRTGQISPVALPVIDSRRGAGGGNEFGVLAAESCALKVPGWHKEYARK